MSFAYSPLSLNGTAGGGGGTGNGRVTVGASGASYTTVSAAVAAGHTALGVITLTNETDDVVVTSSGLQIDIDAGATLNMGSNHFDVGDYVLQIDGGGTLSYSSSDPSYILFDADDLGQVTVSNVTIANTSSEFVCLSDATYARFYDVMFEGDVKVCGDANIYEGCIWKNLTIFVPSGIDNTMIDGSIFEGVLVSDSGNNTVIADSVVF
jgi:hypothetical protein